MYKRTVLSRLVVLLTVIFAAVSLSEQRKTAEDYSYVSNLSKYEKFRGDIRKADLREKRCKNKQLWIFHRHGTRLPSTEELREIEDLESVRDTALKNHEQGRGSLTNEELDSLRKWTFDKSLEAIPFFLTEEGLNETLRTSKRFKEKFPELLNRRYSKDDFYFQHSETQRTTQTSYSFIDGLFGENAHKYVDEHVTPIGQDKLLSPFTGACPKLSKILGNTTLFYAQAKQFEKTVFYLSALNNISKYLGFEKPLAPSKLMAIFGACAYESAWYQETAPISPWCPVLGSQGRKVGEYWWDLVMYSLAGYDSEVTERAGCSPVKDIWERFAGVVGELSYKKEGVVGYFSHDATIMEIHSSLGLLKDDPIINGNNYELQNKRKWRTSRIVPFASNIVAVLQECKKHAEGTEFEVLLFRNEEPWTDIPNCPEGVCTWINFRDFFKPVADNCILEDFC